MDLLIVLALVICLLALAGRVVLGLIEWAGNVWRILDPTQRKRNRIFAEYRARQHERH